MDEGKLKSGCGPKQRIDKGRDRKLKLELELKLKLERLLPNQGCRVSVLFLAAVKNGN